MQGLSQTMHRQRLRPLLLTRQQLGMQQCSQQGVRLRRGWGLRSRPTRAPSSISPHVGQAVMHTCLTLSHMLRPCTVVCYHGAHAAAMHATPACMHPACTEYSARPYCAIGCCRSKIKKRNRDVYRRAHAAAPLSEQQLAGCERLWDQALPHVRRSAFMQGAQPTALTFASMIDHILQTPFSDSVSPDADSFIDKIGSRVWYEREIYSKGRDRWRLTDTMERVWELVRAILGLQAADVTMTHCNSLVCFFTHRNGRGCRVCRSYSNSTHPIQAHTIQ